MYFFYIKKSSSSSLQSLYTPYLEDGEIYTTDNLEELATKYKELIATYPTSQIKVIHELDPDVLVTITD